MAAAALCGVATFGMSIFYAEAATRIPLGMATALEFLGPLGICVVASRDAFDLGWTIVAAAGVYLLTGSSAACSSDFIGIGFALGAAACWAAYIPMTKLVGQTFKGLQGLTVSLTVASILSIPVCYLRIDAHAPLSGVIALIALGLIVPVVPYALEMAALRGLSARGFGIVMSLDPAISAIVGWAVLNQHLAWNRKAGIACVIIASVATAIKRGRRSVS